MTILFPDGVQSLANTSVVVRPGAIVDPEAPTVAEATAGGALNISCFLYSDFLATPSAPRGDKPRRACERKARQGFGVETTEIVALQYSHDPQAASSADANKARTALTPYSTVFIFERQGLDASTESLAEDDIVNLHKVELGAQVRGRTGTGDQDEFAVTQEVSHIQSWYDVALV